MAQHRSLLLRTDALTVERVVPLAATAAIAQATADIAPWSPHYEVATPRMVLPATGAVEFRLGEVGTAGRTLLFDGLTVLRLPTLLPYQMRPCAGAPRSSIVVSEPIGAAFDAEAWMLGPRALWRLRRHWRALAVGRVPLDDTAALLRSVLQTDATPIRHGSVSGRGLAAVLRAQRFILDRTATHDAAPDPARWTLHDVADAAFASPFHLARSFRRHTGTSLHGYRQHLRLAVVLQRLEDGEADLAGLAHRLGYSSQSHLGAAFRSTLGITPGQARAMLAA